MKKFISLMVALVLGIGIGMARDRVTSDPSVLPAAATATINKHFGKVGVNHIKIDENVFGHVDDYDVILNNGTEIEFTADGTVKSVDCGRNAVPAALVIKPIRDYVAANWKGNEIVAIETDRNSYDVELSNGIDLKFDRSGRFLRVDD